MYLLVGLSFVFLLPPLSFETLFVGKGGGVYA